MNTPAYRSSPERRGRPTSLLTDAGVHTADTCEPLERAVDRRKVQLHALARGTYPGKRLEAPSLPEVLTFGHWEALRPQNWGLDWHRNEGIEFTYVSRGSTFFASDEGSSLLQRGHLTVTRPWQVHRVGDPHIGACRLHWLILDVGVRRPHQRWRFPEWLALEAGDLKQLGELLQHNEQTVWRANPAVETHFLRLSRLVEQQNSVGWVSKLRLEIAALLISVLVLLAGQNIALDARLSSRRRSVELLLSTLETQLDAPWNTDRMAQACDLGRTQFVRYCREVTGMAPGAYLTSLRLGACKKLLLDAPDLDITEVARRGGFDSSQYFATVFGRHLGCTPSHFRRRAVQDISER